MIEALALEIAAIRKKGGGTQIELRGGENVGQTEGSWLYRFVVAEDLNLRDDTPIRVVAGQEDVSGVLVSYRDGVLLAALEKCVGPKVPAARLIANDAFLLELLKERLEKVQSGEAQINRQTADRVLGLGAPRTADADPHRAVTQDGELNRDQILAVRRSLGSDTTFVWGPPGTGKTTTIARIVEAHYRAGRSVLLVSNTNIAVDTALERVAERLKGEAEFHQGLVIRHGPVVKEELRQRFGRQVILTEIVARLGESLRREKETLIEEALCVEAEERSLLAALKDWDRLTQVQTKLGARQQARDAVTSNIGMRERQAEQHRATAARLRADLERARSMGAIRRFFSGLDPERLKREIAVAERAERAATDAAHALAADLPKIEGELRSLVGEIERLIEATCSYPPASEIQKRLDIKRTRRADIQERVADIDRELAEIEQQVLARSKILATTVYRTYLGKSPSRQFDVVVVDEASMLMLPLVYYAAGLARTSVTVAGDFRQLPPIVMSDEQLAAEWLKCDVFEKAGVPQRLKRRESTPQLVALGTQYRMREPICAVVNKLFYADQPLRSDPSVNHGGFDFPLATTPLLYVDTAPFHPWVALRIGTYSRYNLFHALLVRNVVLHLAETGFLPPAGEPNNAVGAVAPYASQARLIQAFLDDRLGSRAAGIAATVHRFQGNEKQVMVLDLTDSLGARLGRFFKASRIEEDGARLLNVAASRAKHHVVLIGNFEYLCTKASHNSFVRRMIDHFLQHGAALELDKLLPLAECDWVDGLHRVMPTTFELPQDAAGAFTEGTFYPAFRIDLARVRKSIVIFSPFATGAGTSRWMDFLRAGLQRGVRIRILTRPPGEFGGAGSDEVTALVRGLRDVGVAVDLRARMHEKIAILDGRILWHGSLNILSHRDTHESMLRIDSPAACEQLARFVSTPMGRGKEEHSLDAPENPLCPKCGRPTVWNDGRYGVWFECETSDCDGKVNARRGPQKRPDAANASQGGKNRGQGTIGAKALTGRSCPQPGCGGRLVERNGRFGPFLGCSRYPSCRYTENLT